MASPQLEDGYLRIANEIVDALIKQNLSGQEFRLCLLVLKKTYGFNKLKDHIALSQIGSSLSICKTRCSQIVNRLQLMKILTVTENINGLTKEYAFNKNYDEWTQEPLRKSVTVNKNRNRYGKTNGTVNVLRTTPLRKSVTTKDTLTKDTLTKDNITTAPQHPAHSVQGQFVDQFARHYTEKTGEPYNSTKKDYVIAAQLIKKHGIDVVVDKARRLAVACDKQNIWFTHDDGWRSFTIGKLSTHFNELIEVPEKDSKLDILEFYRKREAEKETAKC